MNDNVLYVSATDLKRNTGKLLDRVYYKDVKKIVVEKNNEPYVELVPVKKVAKSAKKELLEKYIEDLKDYDWRIFDKAREEYRSSFDFTNRL